jgi:predicted transcriptional regulator
MHSVIRHCGIPTWINGNRVTLIWKIHNNKLFAKSDVQASSSLRKPKSDIKLDKPKKCDNPPTLRSVRS